jgi:hypothetical protein
MDWALGLLSCEMERLVWEKTQGGVVGTKIEGADGIAESKRA